MTKSIIAFGLFCYVLCMTVVQAADVYQPGGVALGGYDPTAYFDEGKAIKGTDAIQFQYKRVNWHFRSLEARDRFQANPEQYIPQYGGYCAYAMAQGSKAPIDPQAWSIIDQKLYLNYSMAVRERWLADYRRYIHLADENWPRFQ